MQRTQMTLEEFAAALPTDLSDEERMQQIEAARRLLDAIQSMRENFKRLMATVEMLVSDDDRRVH